MAVKFTIFALAQVSSGISAETAARPFSDAEGIAKLLLEARNDSEITDEQYRRNLDALTDNQCESVKRGLKNSDKMRWTKRIAMIPEYFGARITDSLSLNRWHILHVDIPNAEPIFLFFSDDPEKSDPIMSYGGGDAIYGEPDVEDSILSGAVGIPKSLARCFSWHFAFSPL